MSLRPKRTLQTLRGNDGHAQAARDKSGVLCLFFSQFLPFSLGNKKEREEELPSEVLVISC